MPVNFCRVKQILQITDACVIPQLYWIPFNGLLQRLYIAAACLVCMPPAHQNKLPISGPSFIVHRFESINHDVLFFVVSSCKEASNVKNDIILLRVYGFFYDFHWWIKHIGINIPVFINPFLSELRDGQKYVVRSQKSIVKTSA